MPRLLRNGIALHYQQAGSGPDVVLVHGLAANLAFWCFTVLPLLKRRFRVTIYDLRGHGYSDMPPQGYTTRHMAEDLNGLLEHLGHTRVHLVGHSFGGSVVLHYALLYPRCVASLTLADARVHALQPMARLADRAHWAAVEESMRRRGIALPPHTPKVAYNLLEELADMDHGALVPARRPANLLVPFADLEGNKRTVERWFQLLRTTTAKDDLWSDAGLTPSTIREIRRPVLAIFGERSRCLPTLRGLQQHLPNCRAVIIRGAGHYHPLFKPRAFVRTLTKFVLRMDRAVGVPG